jgi:integrase
LRCRHVDLARGRIHVEENLRIDAPLDDAEAETGDPKRRPAGERYQSHHVHDALRAWRRSMSPTAMSTLAGAGWRPVRPDVGDETSPLGVEDGEVDRAGAARARHSAASMWIASGLPVKAVSELIGHASVPITLDRYGHLLPAALDDAAAAFAAYLDRADTTSRLEQIERAD